MHAENTADLPVTEEVIGNLVVRAERFALANRYVVDEAARKDVGQIKSRDAAIVPGVVRVLRLTAFRAKRTGTTPVDRLRPRVGNDVREAVSGALLPMS